MNDKVITIQESGIKVVEDKTEFFTICSQQIPNGEVIFKIEGITEQIPNKYTIQMGENVHIYPSIGRFINHSCAPSAYIDFNDGTMRARINLEKGDEITFNYNTSEYIMAAPFKCFCGQPNCIGEIKGYKFLSIEQKHAIEAYTSNYLKEIALK